MTQQKALSVLGLTDTATVAEIQQALQQKRTDLQQQQASAPTEALANKFTAALAQLEQAGQLLTSRREQTSSPMSDNNRNRSDRSASSLSHTKLADLPGMSPQDSAQLELQPGQLLANRYEIKELIGQGGMGAVYRAFDQNRSEDIAIKVLLPSLTQNQRALERFLDEARISSKLSHPNIVNVFDVQNEGSLYFLTMELLEGQTLRHIMDNQTMVGRPFELNDAKAYIQGICDALHYAHQFTVHRDIKPENIWLDESGKVKLMDFGIARVQSASQRTQTGAAMGTAYYMAPEQLQGRELDARADIYAVGVMLYEMLTGQIPVGRYESANTLRKDINKSLSATIDKALSVNAEQRFADAEELKNALLSGKTAKVKSTKPAALQNREPNKLVLAAMVVLVVGGIGVAWQQGWLEALKPLDKELIVQQKAEAAGLQGEIKTLKRRFDNEVRDLDSDIRDAERDKNNKEAQRLQAWMDMAKHYLVDSPRYGELEGLESQANLHLREDSQSAQALAVLTQAREGYQTLIDDFYAGESVSALSPQIDALRKQWQSYPNSKLWPVSDKVETLYQEAHQHETDGLLRLAEPQLNQLQSGYSALIAANDDISKVDQSLQQVQAAWQKLADSKKLTKVPEIEALQQEERQHRDALDIAAELPAVTAAMSGLQGQITSYQELTDAVANLDKAEKAVLSAKASYEKSRKGYPIEISSTAKNAGEQLLAAQAALINQQWVAAGKGFADARGGYDSARTAEAKVITSINQARSEQKKAQEAKAAYEQLRGYDPEPVLAAKADRAWAASNKAFAARQWSHAVGNFVEAQKGFVEARSRSLPSYAAKQISAAMVKIPAGNFSMGSNNGERVEKPVHTVSVSSFHLLAHEVTWSQFQPCIDAGVCSSGGDRGWGKGNRPVINVSWNDIQTYIGWLNTNTGQKYRLPTEAEWEYAARDGSSSNYSWGNNIGSGRANCDGCGSQWDKSQTAPVKSFSANGFGLYDMHGNVWEWVQDCWHDSYRGTPANGQAWESGGDCGKRVLRGGSWSLEPEYLRAAYRFSYSTWGRGIAIGFRLVQDI